MVKPKKSLVKKSISELFTPREILNISDVLISDNELRTGKAPDKYSTALGLLLDYVPVMAESELKAEPWGKTDIMIDSIHFYDKDPEQESGKLPGGAKWMTLDRAIKRLFPNATEIAAGDLDLSERIYYKNKASLDYFTSNKIQGTGIYVKKIHLAI